MIPTPHVRGWRTSRRTEKQWCVSNPKAHSPGWELEGEGDLKLGWTTDLPQLQVWHEEWGFSFFFFLEDGICTLERLDRPERSHRIGMVGKGRWTILTTDVDAGHEFLNTCDFLRQKKTKNKTLLFFPFPNVCSCFSSFVKLSRFNIKWI